MTAYTVEELAAMIIAPEPNIEDYHENGAYDSASFHEAYGVWETRIKLARQMLDLIAERNRLTAENRALQDDIVRLTADLVIEAEQHQNAAETCLSLKQELDASSVLLTRAQTENRALQAKIDAAMELDDKQHAQLEWIERSLISKQAQVKHLNARDDIILSVSEVALLVSLVRKHYPIREPLSTEAKINENLKERLLTDDAK